MKIAYVTIAMNRRLAFGGVGRKMDMQVKIWQEAGHQAEVFVLSTEALPDLDWHVFPATLFESHSLVKIIKRELLSSYSLLGLIRAVREFQPDIIFFRYYRYHLGLKRLFKIAPVVIELNTNDLIEMGMRSRLQGTFNRLTRSIIFRSAAAFNPVSYEIGVIPKNNCHHLPTLVLGNGIDIEKFFTLTAPSNRQPRFAMVSSDVVPWHGVDKVVRFMRRNPDLHMDLVGYKLNDFEEALPANISLHGFLPPDGVRDVLSRADVVFGTMALHRKEMKEASPLKVREALAFGIPVVIAYEDTDLMGLELDTILRIPNTEDNLETYSEAVRDFAYRMRGRRVPREQIADRIDWREKEAQRLEFFEQILTSRKDRRGGKTG